MPFQRILVPFDRSRACLRALAIAERIAGGAAAVHLLEVTAPVPRPAPVAPLAGAAAAITRDAQAKMLDEVRQQVRTAVETLSGRGIPAQSFVDEGDPAAAILAHIREFAVDLVVMGSHGRSLLQRQLLGSVAHSVFTRTEVPMIVARPDVRTPSEGDLRVLVAVDESAASGRAVKAAAELAATTPCALTLFQVVAGDSPPAWQKTADWYRRPALQPSLRLYSAQAELHEAGFRAEVALSVGDAAPEILEFVEKEGCELVVMASHRRTGLNRLVNGSVTERLIRQAGAAVLVA